MRLWFALILAAMVLSAPLLALTARANGEGPRRALSAEGYERVIQDVFARNGWLTTETSGMGDDGRPLVVDLTDAARRNPVAMDYYRNSYLRADIERNDAALWLIDGVVLGAAPGAHNQSSPFAADGWRGRLLLRPQPPRFEFERADGGSFEMAPGVIAAPGEVATPRDIAVFDPALGAGGADATPTAVVDLFDSPDPDARRRLARLRMFGRIPYVQAVGPGVVVDRTLLAEGRWAPLYSGSQIWFRTQGRSARFLARGLAADAVTMKQGLGDRFRLAGYEPLALAFETAMDEAAARCANRASCDVARDDFSLTLDPGLQAWLQGVLSADRSGSAFPAAITVMNARSGELLALASYDPKAAGVTAAPGARPSPPVNYNFELLPVGSAAKLPLSAAILAERPDLASLIILKAPTEQVGKDLRAPSVLGVSLGEPAKWLGVHPLAPPIDFRSYVQHSSNLYAASLILLGGDRVGEGPGEPLTPAQGVFSVGGVQPQYLPPLPFRIVGAGDAARWGERRTLPIWGPRMRALFDIDIETPLTPAYPGRYGLGSSDMSIWAPVLDRAPPRPGSTTPQPPSLAALAAISPRRQNLRLDAVRNMRTDYIPIILGGANYGWSQVKLAESYARIVTGRRVRATLVERAGDGAPPLARPLGDLPAGVRATLCSAMETVAQGDGTASGVIGPAIAQVRSRITGPWVGLYSKTGTPEIEPSRVSDQEAAENELIAHRLIVIDDNAAAVRPSRATEARPVRTAADVVRAAALLEKDPVAEAILRQHGASARAAMQRLLKYNTVYPENRSRYLVVSREGAVKKVVSEGVQPSMFAHTYVFVIGLYDSKPASCEAAEPTSAYVVAITLLDPDGSAQALAKRVLLEQLAPRLAASAMAEVRRP